jgi:predicted small lipoprotein YifL
VTRALLFRLTLACAVAVALAGCGRKGALDLPPTAAAAATEQPAAGPITPPIGDMAARPPSPPAPPPPNRPFALDPLLN